MKLNKIVTKTRTVNEAIEDMAVSDENYGVMGHVMADAIRGAKKRKEAFAKVMQDKAKDLPNQDRFAHTKVKGNAELKKMHLAEDAFEMLDVRNRGGKNRESLREDVNTNKLVSFLKKAYEDLTTGGGEATWNFKLGNGLYYVMACAGDPTNYDAEDVKLFATSEDGDSIVLGKIAVNSDDLQSDYDWDWTMPYEEDGDVWDTEREFYKDEDFESVAKGIMSDYDEMKDSNIAEDGRILGGDLEESLDVSQTNPIDTTKSIAGRKPIKEGRSSIMSAEEFLDWHDNKVNPREDMGKLDQIYNIFKLNGCSEDDYVDDCYDECDDKQKREIMDIIMTESFKKMNSRKSLKNESFLNETDDVDSKKCADILNNWIDWEACDYDSDCALDQLRSLQTEKAITDKEYDFIVKNWDDLLQENFGDEETESLTEEVKGPCYVIRAKDNTGKVVFNSAKSGKSYAEMEDVIKALETESALSMKNHYEIDWVQSGNTLTEGVKFGQSSFNDLVSVIKEYYKDHSSSDTIDSIFELMTETNEDETYKLVYAVAERVEEFVGEELEDSQKYPIESPFEKKEKKGNSVQADQKYPIKPSGDKKDSQFVKAEQKAPVGLTESKLVDDQDEKLLTEDVKVIIDLGSFQPWTESAIETWYKIKDNNKVDTLDFMLEDMYPEGITETELNDLLRFDSEWVLDMVGLSDDEVDTEEDTEETVDVDDTAEVENHDITTDNSEYDIDVTDDEAAKIAEGLLQMMDSVVSDN